MVRASDCLRSSVIGRLVTRLCGALKKVAAGSIVFRWTDRADAVDHATAWSAPHKDGYLPGFLGLRRLAAEPFFKLAAQWVAAMVPALILLSEDRERASVVLMALVGTAWAAHAGTATLEDQAFNRAYGRWLALLLLGSAFSVVFGSGDIQLAIWYEWIFWWLAAWLAYRSGRLIISTRYFGVVLAGVGILFGILAVWQKTAGYGDVAGWMPAALRPTVGARAIGFFGNPNVFAAAVNLVLWPLAALLIESAGRRMPLRKGTYAVGLAGLILALLLTWSRAALLGAIGAAVILMVMTPKATAFHRTKARPGFWIAIGAAMVLIVTFLTPLGIGAGGAAEGAGFIQGQQAAWQGRLTIWQEALALFWQNPLSGGGPGSLSNIALPDGAQALHAHNMLLQWLAETGLIQTLIMLLVIIWYGVQAWKRVPHSLLLCGFTAAISAILIHGFFDYPLAARPIGLLWWVWIGFGLSRAVGK